MNNLNKIKKWDWQNPRGLFEFMKSLWWPNDEDGIEFKQCKNIFGREVIKIEIHTWGWSENEEIISAFDKNYIFWSIFWKHSDCGGHFYFEVPLEMWK
jgi:hypothetical protein